jgi:hypothetical protein
LGPHPPADTSLFSFFARLGLLRDVGERGSDGIASGPGADPAFTRAALGPRAHAADRGMMHGFSA